jgi:hypothetical protein
MTGSCLAQFDTIINVPPDAAPMFVGSNTQLNLMESGVIPSSSSNRFQAGLMDGSEDVQVNVSGGSLGDWAQFFFTEFNLSGGSVGERLLLGPGTDGTISGGIVGDHFEMDGANVYMTDGSIGRFASATNTLFLMSGGTVGEDFTTSNATDMDISGGVVGGGLQVDFDSYVVINGGIVGSNSRGMTVKSGGVAFPYGGRIYSLHVETGGTVEMGGGHFIAGMTASPGSNVAVFGGEFLLSGEVPSSRMFQVPLGEVLTGTLSDGSPFIFRGGSEFRVINSPLPPINPVPVVLDGETDKTGLRQGESLTLVDGGVLGEHFIVVNATLHVTGGDVAPRLDTVGATIEISGGHIGRLGEFRDSDVLISGGDIDDNLTVVGGNMTISGGKIGKFFTAGEKVRVSGGIFEADFFALESEQVEFIGEQFLLDGEPIPGLTDAGDSVVLTERGGQLLTGTFADGSPFDFILNNELVINDDLEATRQDAFGDSTILKLTIVPEPGSAVLATMIVLGVVSLRLTAKLSATPPGFRMPSLSRLRNDLVE